MFSCDRMPLSRILNFVSITEEDFPLGVVAASEVGMVFGTFYFIFLSKGTS